MIKSRKDMVAKTGREEARSGETGHRRRKQPNLAKAEANPTTRMNGIPAKSRSSRSQVESPRVAAPSQSESREIGTAIEVGREIDGKDEAR